VGGPWEFGAHNGLGRRWDGREGGYDPVAGDQGEKTKQ